MAKKYLNGWQAPVFKIAIPNQPEQTIELNLRFQAFNEYVEENYIEHELLDGTIVEKFLYAHYYWELNYSSLAEASELLKIKSILNYIQRGYTIRLYPHKEVQRYFFVTTVKERLTLGRHYGGSIAPGEKDFGITFRTMRPVTTAGNAINWVNLDEEGTPVSEILNQYKYLADETGDYLLDGNGEPIVVEDFD